MQPSVWDLPPYLNWILGYKYFGASEGRQVFIKNVRNFLKGKVNMQCLKNIYFFKLCKKRKKKVFS